MLVTISIIVVLCLLLEVQHQDCRKKLRKKDVEIKHLEASLNFKRESRVLPNTVWDKEGNEYHRLFGEFGNDEFTRQQNH